MNPSLAIPLHDGFLSSLAQARERLNAAQEDDESDEGERQDLVPKFARTPPPFTSARLVEGAETPSLLRSMFSGIQDV